MRKLFLISFFLLMLLLKVDAQDYRIFGAGLHSIFSTKLDGSDPEEIIDLPNDDSHPNYSVIGSELLAGVKYHNGRLYGLSRTGGEGGQGTLFSINLNGEDIRIHQNYSDPDANPQSHAMLLNEGIFYGVIPARNENGGKIFCFNVVENEYKEFDLPTIFPASRLSLINGQLWGSSIDNGNNNYGTLFKIDLDGTGYKVIHHFDGTNGSSPYNNPLTLHNGLIYGGSESYGSGDGDGFIYSMKPDGTAFEVIHDFTNSGITGPIGNLIIANSKIWGLGTSSTDGGGGIFSIDPTTKVFKVINDFSNEGDPEIPLGELTYHDGYLYGSSMRGGDNGYGTIWRVKDDGSSFEVIFSATSVLGFSPWNLTPQIIDIDNAEEVTLSLENSSILKIYPNPTHQYFKLNKPTEFNEIHIYSVDGKLHKSFTQASELYNVASLKSGIYFLKDKDHKFLSRLVINE